MTVTKGKCFRKLMAIDGKTPWHSLDTSKARRPLYSVSAWVAECHGHLVQVATEEKSSGLDVLFSKDKSHVWERTLAQIS